MLSGFILYFLLKFKTYIYEIKVLFIYLFILIGCSKDDIPESNNVAGKVEHEVVKNKSNGSIPFTVENVNKALQHVLAYYSNFRPEVAERFSNYQVETTHLYMKFSPQDSIQYTELIQYEELFQLSTVPFEEWRDKLVNNYSNTTEMYIDDVFNYAQYVRNNNL